MAEKESGFRYFWNDLTNVKLIKPKLIWFTTLFSVVVLWPFLSLHMVQIGLTERDIGIVASLSAAVSIITPFMWGIIADKIGNFKFLVSGLTFMTGIISLLFIAVPSTGSSTSLANSNSTTNVTLSQPTTVSSTSLTNITLTQQGNGNYATTFWSYLIVRVMYVLGQGASYLLYDAAVMCYSQEKNIDYGMQRAWGTLAAGISPFIGGMLKDVYGMQLLFYVSAAYSFITATALLFFNIEFKNPAKGLHKEIWTQIINMEMIMLLLTCISVGAVMGYVETYTYIFLNRMGASNTLIGLTVSVGVPFDIIIQICATALVVKVGHLNSILIGVFFYSLRTLGLSFLTNPWWVLPIEILDAVSQGLFSTCSFMYITEMVTLTSLASFRGLIGVAKGIGKVLGTSIGTIIREYLGDRATFRVMSGIALATAMIYLISYQILIKYRSHQKFEVESQKQTTKEETEKGLDNPAWVDNT